MPSDVMILFPTFPNGKPGLNPFHLLSQDGREDIFGIFRLALLDLADQGKVNQAGIICDVFPESRRTAAECLRGYGRL